MRPILWTVGLLEAHVVAGLLHDMDVVGHRFAYRGCGSGFRYESGAVVDERSRSTMVADVLLRQ